MAYRFVRSVRIYTQRERERESVRVSVCALDLEKSCNAMHGGSNTS